MRNFSCLYLVFLEFHFSIRYTNFSPSVIQQYSAMFVSYWPTLCFTIYYINSRKTKRIGLATRSSFWFIYFPQVFRLWLKYYCKWDSWEIRDAFKYLSIFFPTGCVHPKVFTAASFITTIFFPSFSSSMLPSSTSTPKKSAYSWLIVSSSRSIYYSLSVVFPSHSFILNVEKYILGIGVWKPLKYFVTSGICSNISLKRTFSEQ